ncbi:MAG: TatD family hydrolase [Eubacterium sp.]|nr:TatD family hydrolase [Eubacterium sp.]
MLETDAPYLTPVPFRGKVNEPDNVRIVCERVAEILGMSAKEVTLSWIPNLRHKSLPLIKNFTLSIAIL